MQTPIQITSSELLFFGAYPVQLHVAGLVILLLAATAVDVREHRIPNRLVATGISIGVLFHAFAPQGMGIAFALSGLGLGLAALFPLYALRLMGAGDVKLMGMIGAFLGASGVIGAVLATMAAGGVLAIVLTACKRALPQMLMNLHLMLIQRRLGQMGGPHNGGVSTMPSVGKMPYAVAICAGTLIQLSILRY